MCRTYVRDKGEFSFGQGLYLCATKQKPFRVMRADSTEAEPSKKGNLYPCKQWHGSCQIPRQLPGKAIGHGISDVVTFFCFFNFSIILKIFQMKGLFFFIYAANGDHVYTRWVLYPWATPPAHTQQFIVQEAVPLCPVSPGKAWLPSTRSPLPWGLAGTEDSQDPPVTSLVLKSTSSFTCLPCPILSTTDT